MSNSGKIYIVTVRHGVGDEVLFWRPNASGYTTRLDEAGVYPAGDASPDIAIPVEVAERLAVRVVPSAALARDVEAYRAEMHPCEEHGLSAEYCRAQAAALGEVASHKCEP